MTKISYNVIRTGFTQMDDEGFGVHHFEAINFFTGHGEGKFIDVPGHQRSFISSTRYLITVEEV